ncbi:cytochrome b reductase related protein [Cyclospora cayetanensis]|uniref:Cytochrome b reductase related protein n=1 Tax=Cyclospora cayetanensis TaxID=88456 RepID=A0A1D3D599_9EIME|nr:cytochrome b reductase related protein [Cyclospora cayetanensis]
MERDTPTRVFLLFTQVCILVLAGAQLALCLQPEWGNGFSVYDIASAEFFNLHPLLNVLAFGVAMTESLISFQGFGLRHGVAKTLHALLQLASLILGIAAFSIVVAYHNANSYPNFYSVHSWIGLTVYVFAWTQFLGGLFIFWLPGLAPPALKAAFLRYHKVLGVLGADRTTSAGCEASRPGDPSCATPFPPPGTADTGFMGAENQPSAQLRRNKAPSNRPVN